MPREDHYQSAEFTDEFLQTQADAGDHLLDQEGFQYRLTQAQIKKLVVEGLAVLFIESLRRK